MLKQCMKRDQLGSKVRCSFVVEFLDEFARPDIRDILGE